MQEVLLDIKEYKSTHRFMELKPSRNLNESTRLIKKDSFVRKMVEEKRVSRIRLRITNLRILWLRLELF